MGSISPAVKGWSMATGSSRSSGWERVHVGPRTGFPHNRSGAADMIRVAVSENQVLELTWRTAKPTDRPEDGALLTRETGVDQCQPVVGLDQEGICHAHWDDVHTFDHTLHSHRQNPSKGFHCKRKTDSNAKLKGQWSVPVLRTQARDRSVRNGGGLQ